MSSWPSEPRKPAGRRVAVIGTGAASASGRRTPSPGRVLNCRCSARKRRRNSAPSSPRREYPPKSRRCGHRLRGFRPARAALRIISADPLIDAIVITIHVDWTFNFDEGQAHRSTCALSRRTGAHTSGKPIRQLAALPNAPRHRGGRIEALRNPDCRRRSLYEGLLRTASALSKVVAYHEFQRGLPPG